MKISMKKFMRYADAEVVLPPKGLVLVTGVNGSGKSTLHEAIAYARWGKTIRGTSPWRKDEAGTLSCVGAGVRINRGWSGKRAKLKTWQLDDDAATPTKWETSTKAQAALTEVLGSFDVWRRTHVFSVRDMASFTEDADKSRKLLLETLLGLGRFDEAHEQCSTDYKIADAALVSATQTLLGAQARLEEAERAIGPAQVALAAIEIPAEPNAPESPGPEPVPPPALEAPPLPEATPPPEASPLPEATPPPEAPSVPVAPTFDEDLAPFDSTEGKRLAEVLRLTKKGLADAREELVQAGHAGGEAAGTLKAAKTQAEKLAGDDCPLCGQEIGDDCRGELVAAVMQAELEAKREATAADEDADDLRGDVEALEVKRVSIEAKLELQRSARQAHAADVQTAAAEVKAGEAAHTAAVKAHKAAHAAVVKAHEAAHAAAVKTHEAAHVAVVAAHEAEHAAAVKAHGVAHAAAVEAHEAAHVAAVEVHAREVTAYEQATKAYEQATRAVASAEKAQAAAQAGLDALVQRVADTTKEVAEATADVDSAGLHARVLKTARHVLGTKGVRAHLLGGAVAALDVAARAWLGRMACTLEIRIRAYAERKDDGGLMDSISMQLRDVSESEEWREYRSFSGGERQRADVAVLLALSELGQAAHEATTDALFFDEVFDSLDAEGIAAVGELLREMAETRCVVVISHSPFAKTLNPVAEYRAHRGVISRAA